MTSIRLGSSTTTPDRQGPGADRAQLQDAVLRGSEKMDQSPSSFPLARNSSTCPSPSSIMGSPLVHDELSSFYTPPQASLILEDESIRQQPRRALSGFWNY